MIEFIFACIGGLISLFITSNATEGVFFVHPVLSAMGCMLLGAVIGFIVRNGGAGGINDIGDFFD